MSKAFAEKILDSMVDENGHCGERGLSGKQFDIILKAMDVQDREEHDIGWWEGNYTTMNFWALTYTGNVGKYHVSITERCHFNMGYNVESIDLRDPDEYKAEQEAEAKLEAMKNFSGSEWVSEPKKRIDLTLTLVVDHQCEGYAYYYGDSDIFHIYTFRDQDGNCIVWKTKNPIGFWDEDGRWVGAEQGDTVTMRATVKEHGEYRGTKQTVITRPKVNGVN